MSTYKDCLSILVCDESTPECYFGDCLKCPKPEVLEKLLVEVLNRNKIETVSYKQWIAKSRTTLEDQELKTTEFCKAFSTYAKQLLHHSFIAKEQGNFLKEAKNNLKNDEILVLCDFSENYAFVMQDAAPGFHWNNNQATVFPVVMYYK